MGSTSTNFCSFFSNEQDAYILGLWCAEKYSWSSSIGLSNTAPDLLEKFASFLRKLFPVERLKLRIYYPTKVDWKIDKKILALVGGVIKRPNKNAKKIGYHLYVNSRSLLREFMAAESRLNNLKDTKTIRAYMAGRFDGNGSIDKNLQNDCRIVYTRQSEAKIDKRLLKRIGVNNTKIYYYRTSNTFCLYISRYETNKFLKSIFSYSLKLQKLVLVPPRDLTLVGPKRV